MAQIAKDNYPLLLGTGEVTQDESIQLFWNQRKYVKTIKLDLRRNIGMTHTAPGIHKCQEFITQQVIQTPCPCCFDTHIIPDDDDEVSLQPPDPIQTNIQETPPPFPLQQQEQPSAMSEQESTTLPTTTQVDFTPLQQIKPNLIEQEDEPTRLNPSDELLRWHYKLGHAPFKMLQRMATQGDLSHHFAQPANMANKQNAHGAQKVHNSTYEPPCNQDK